MYTESTPDAVTDFELSSFSDDRTDIAGTLIPS
jgi:hypothetical protein